MMIRLASAMLAINLAQAAGPAHAGAREEADKRPVLKYCDAALKRRDFAAASKHFGALYIQHNPTASDGIEGFKKFRAFLREKFRNGHSKIKRAFAEGDFVILHVDSKREPDQRGRAIVDIFRLADDKIVERWDDRTGGSGEGGKPQQHVLSNANLGGMQRGGEPWSAHLKRKRRR